MLFLSPMACTGYKSLFIKMSFFTQSKSPCPTFSQPPSMIALHKQHVIVIANSQAESPCPAFSQPHSMMALFKHLNQKALVHIFTTPINDGIQLSTCDSHISKSWVGPPNVWSTLECSRAFSRDQTTPERSRVLHTGGVPTQDLLMQKNLKHPCLCFSQALLIPAIFWMMFKNVSDHTCPFPQLAPFVLLLLDLFLM